MIKRTLVTNWPTILLVAEGNQNWSIYGNQTYFGYLWSPTIHWSNGGRTIFWLPTDNFNSTMLEGCRMATKNIQLPTNLGNWTRPNATSCILWQPKVIKTSSGSILGLWACVGPL
jgi:hypothetical protein